MDEQEMKRLAKEEHQQSLQFIENEREKLRVKWEPSGLLGQIENIKDQRTMATLLETQTQQLLYMQLQYNDDKIPSIMKEQYTEWLSSVLIPITTRVFRPVISEIGAMGLPASLGETGTIVAKTRKLGEIPHIKTFNCTGYYGLDCEADYFDEVAPLMQDMFLKLMEEERTKTPDKKVNFFVYVPLILGTLRDMELNPVKFGVTIRYAVERVDA